jgi:acyl-CoA synthetase (NDP forming)
LSAGTEAPDAAPAATPSLERMLQPRSVAVVGATDREGSYGAQALLNLAEIGFEGTVWGVNPGRSEVLGRPCVPSVAELPEPVDAVIVAIPAAGVAAAIDQAGARCCGGAVVFSAGFEEVASGREHARELMQAAARHGLPVCGPNCNGIVSPGRRVALWGDALAAQQGGRVALISQSGNVAVNALAAGRGLRFHTVIASGNQSVLSSADYLQTLARQDDLGAVALYLEDDGGAGLLDGLAACADARIPVVVLKVGRSAAGARAAAAHSGALAGDQRVFRSLVDEAGAVWAHDVHELLELSKTLSVKRSRGAQTATAPVRGTEAVKVSDPDGHRGSPPAPQDLAELGGVSQGGLAIMTCSGGDSAQGADEAAKLGLALPALKPETLAQLEARLPSAATAANPLDYTAMIWGDVDALAGLVTTLGADPAIDVVLVFYDQPKGLTGAAADSWAAVREGITLGAARCDAVTLVSSTLPELLDDEAAWEFASAGVPTAAGLRTGLRCAEALLARADGDAEPDRGERLRAIASTARAGAARKGTATGDWLPEHEAKALLRDAGIPVPAGRVVTTAEDAAGLTGPIVLKVSAASVQHKSEIGGVVVGLTDPPQIADAHRRLTEIAAEHGGVVLAETMAHGELELIVAAHRDGVVPALVIGLGGIWTELLQDVAVLPLPADARQIERAIRSLRGAPMLTGGRGRTPLDLQAAAHLAQKIGELLIERELAVVECNPVLVAKANGGAVALDAAVRLAG